MQGDIETLENMAFNNCEKLKHCDIIGSIKEVSKGAFSMCDSLQELTLKGTRKVYEEAFNGSGIHTLNIDTDIIVLGKDSLISNELKEINIKCRECHIDKDSGIKDKTINFIST